MKKPKILILGDSCLDEFLHSKSYGLAPEATIPVLKVERIEHRLGMAANVAVNLSKMNCETHLWTFFDSKDKNYSIFENLISKENIKWKHFSGLQLTVKQRGVVGTTYISRNDYEIVHPISIVNQLKKYKKQLKQFDAIILSDYGKSVIGYPRELISFLKEVNLKAKVFVDPDKNKTITDYARVFCVKANEKESLAITGQPNINSALLEMGNWCSWPIITLSEKGTKFTKYNFTPVLATIEHINAVKTQQIDCVGAGDSYVASLVYNVCLSKSIEQSIKQASKDAARAVEKFGT